MGKLTDKVGNRISNNKLTDKTDTKFALGLGIPIEKDYSFSRLQIKDNKDFQRFLDKISNMTVQQVESSFGRRPDKNDLYEGDQVLHYAITDSFRIHVVYRKGAYQILRLDPNHKVHQ